MNADLGTLAAALGEDGVLLTDRDVVASYRADWAADPEAGWPDAVVRARDSSDVQATLRWANAARVPVVPRGAGSGLSGGATAIDHGIVLSLERLRDLRVDPVSRVAVAGAGVLNVQVKAAAADHGLAYPPDPSSFEMCSIGGNVATNAGGLCCVKYGVTADYVLGLQVVLADGRLVRLGGPRLKDAAGLSLTKLFVGSEGTLGVITEATLRLVPAPPPFATMVATFPLLDAASDAVLAITSKLRPSMLELMDHTTIEAVERHTRMGLDVEAEALLIARSDAAAPVAMLEIEEMAQACRGCGAIEVYRTQDPAEGEAFAAARRAALPAFDLPGKTLILDDVGIELALLPSLIRGIQRIGREHDTTIAIVAHAGDGNTHPLIVYDSDDGEAAKRAEAAFDAVMRLVLTMGGTITGEHGVGRLKKPWLASYLGADVLTLTRTVKSALDPHGILNPGCLV